MSEQKLKQVKYVIGPEPKMKLEFESGDYSLIDPIELFSNLKDAFNDLKTLGSD